jgi:predicted methyltransferase
MKPFLALLALTVATGAEARSFPAPDRPVAAIVAPMWWSERERDAVDETGQLVRGLGVRPGMTVADIGAGSGYHTVRLSPVVGPTGRVYAQDVTPAYLDVLRRTVAAKGLTNVETVLGSPADPGLAPASLDRAILVHMYHEIAQPYGLLWNLAGSMKPGGRVGVVDLNAPIARHGTPPALLRCEFEAVGYRQISFRTLAGGVGYLAIFEAPSPATRPAPEAIKPCRDPTAR